MKKSRRDKNKETKRRFDAIKDLMSTFAMSTVAVVAAVTLIPASPKADIIKVVELSEEIVYQINVTDEDNALDLDTLHVVLENQLEYYEKAVELGEHSGYFENLNADTEYRLSVYGNKGFGQERLDTVMVTTKERVGGTILSVTPTNHEYFIDYLVEVTINDPTNKYYLIELNYDFQVEFDDNIFTNSIEITEDRMSIEISDVSPDYPITLYLQGYTSDGVELLDEIEIIPPFKLNIMIGENYLNKDEIGFVLYNESETIDVSYTMNVYKNTLLVQSKDVSNTQSGDYHGTSFAIENLLVDTEYRFECIATYINPKTLREERITIYDEKLRTLKEYSYTLDIIKDEEIGMYFITINIDDPSHYFQLAYYRLVDISGEYEMYISNEEYSFMQESGEKFTNFEISIPQGVKYKLEIGIKNEEEFSINEKIETIIDMEEE